MHDGVKGGGRTRFFDVFTKSPNMHLPGSSGRVTGGMKYTAPDFPLPALEI